MNPIRTIRRLAAQRPEERRAFFRQKIQRIIGGLRFGILPASRGVTYSSYHPDSEWCFGMHPEIRELMKRWLHGNRTNNAGDLARYYALVLNIKQLETDGIKGDFAELGVYLGNSAAVLAHFAAASGRRLFLFDTFGGFDSRDLTGVDARRNVQFQDTSRTPSRPMWGTPLHAFTSAAISPIA